MLKAKEKEGGQRKMRGRRRRHGRETDRKMR